MITLNTGDAEALAVRALVAAGTSAANAASTARALVAADMDGQSGHGLSRVPAYAAQVKAGKIAGHAVPTAARTRAASVRIDAHGGFAYPALDLAITELKSMAAAAGVAAATIHGSHHIGQAGRSVERLADGGFVALIVSNTPRAMAFHGGARPMMGTNPLAFAAPVAGREPIVIDLSLSLVARSKVVAAKQAGRKIPLDWATDAGGAPTDDPAAALAGALQPAGGAKGAALALMVEILCGALAGGRFGWEASSFLDDRGDPPGVGQVLIAFDVTAFAGAGYTERVAALLAAVAAEPGVRVPGDRRLAQRRRALSAGLAMTPELHAEISRIAGLGE